MIGGAAVGAFIIGNDGPTIKHTLKDLALVFKGTKWRREDYQDLLCLLFTLLKIARKDPVAIEAHIEEPGGLADLPSLSPDPGRQDGGRHDQRHDSHGDDEL